MRKQIMFGQYRLMDVCMFTLILCISETLIVFASNVWFRDQLYTLSLTAAVSALVMIRWGLLSAVPAVAGAWVMCLFSGADAAQYLVYGAGNLAFLLLYPIFVRGGRWKRVRGDVLLCMLYGALCAVFMQAGRAGAALLAGNPLSVCAGFFLTDSLSAVFAVLIVWIARRLDGMLEDQKHYLFRIQKEVQDKKGE